MIKMPNDNILVIAAHPDDEVLGAGGTLRKHVKDGDIVYCLILSNGAASRKSFKMEHLKVLEKECMESGMIIGFKKIDSLKLPDNKFDEVPLLDIIKQIEPYIEKIKPKKIYTHHPGDVNIDHKLTYLAVMTICRPCSNFCPDEIYSFETLSSTEWQTDNKKLFAPNVFIDIEGEMDDKISAIDKYASEMRIYPHPRSAQGVRILASFRGLQCNKRYAEAFRLERKIA
jgi:LmbE family N-acetylglucosaminyl deacetylase